MSEAATRAKWASRVDAWQASGTSAAVFAEGKGFAGSTLRWWEGKLRRASKEPLPVAMARVVRTSPSEPASARALRARASADAPSATVAIDVDGVQIAVRRGFDAELLRQVVQALGGER
jgi:hypothetical protein